MPAFQVILHVICPFNRNEDVKRRQIIYGKSLKISQENVYDGAFSIKLETYSVQTATLKLQPCSAQPSVL